MNDSTSAVDVESTLRFTRMTYGQCSRCAATTQCLPFDVVVDNEDVEVLECMECLRRAVEARAIAACRRHDFRGDFRYLNPPTDFTPLGEQPGLLNWRPIDVTTPANPGVRLTLADDRPVARPPFGGRVAEVITDCVETFVQTFRHSPSVLELTPDVASYLGIPSDDARRYYQGLRVVEVPSGLGVVDKISVSGGGAVVTCDAAGRQTVGRPGTAPATTLDRAVDRLINPASGWSYLGQAADQAADQVASRVPS